VSTPLPSRRPANAVAQEVDRWSILRDSGAPAVVSAQPLSKLTEPPHAGGSKRWEIRVSPGTTFSARSNSQGSCRGSVRPRRGLCFHDPVFAPRYGQEWERLWNELEEMKARYW